LKGGYRTSIPRPDRNRRVDQNNRSSKRWSSIHSTAQQHRFQKSRICIAGIDQTAGSVETGLKPALINCDMLRICTGHRQDREAIHGNLVKAPEGRYDISRGERRVSADSWTSGRTPEITSVCCANHIVFKADQGCKHGNRILTAEKRP